MSASRITRRSFLGGTTLILAGSQAARSVPAAPAGSAASTATVDVLLDEPIGVIAPELYGHFAEHIGGVIYDGIWVGEDSAVPNLGGIRKSLVDWMKRLRPAVIRWPGGCFADGYHWRDGIGEREKRPRRYGRWTDVTEPNHFGSHEFIRFCRLVDAQPYMAANVGTGTPEEFQSWVEYCNAPAGLTTLADERAANGAPDPLGIRYWGVGNESWGCGGKFTPEDYCTDYRKFATWVPGYGVPLYLIASGPNGNDPNWTARFFQKWVDYERAPLHGWSPHYYCGTAGEALQFSTDQWYELLARAKEMEKLISDQWAVMGKFDPQRKVRLVIDEWGAWHKPGTEINKRHLFEQMGCLRDALVAALTLDTFNRHADKMAMANVAQLINNLHSLFLADGDRFVATPNFYVFEMYKPHQGATAVRVNVEAPAVEFRVGSDRRQLFGLAGSASVREKAMTLTLVNPHDSEPVAAAVNLKGGAARAARRTVLTHAQANAHNTFERPNELVSQSGDVEVSGAAFTLELPPKSIARWDITLG
jgi:alpha-N-arabinofuranosidase